MASRRSPIKKGGAHRLAATINRTVIAMRKNVSQSKKPGFRPYSPEVYEAAERLEAQNRELQEAVSKLPLDAKEKALGELPATLQKTLCDLMRPICDETIEALNRRRERAGHPPLQGYRRRE